MVFQRNWITFIILPVTHIITITKFIGRRKAPLSHLGRYVVLDNSKPWEQNISISRKSTPSGVPDKAPQIKSNQNGKPGRKISGLRNFRSGVRRWIFLSALTCCCSVLGKNYNLLEFSICFPIVLLQRPGQQKKVTICLNFPFCSPGSFPIGLPITASILGNLNFT